MRSPFVVLTLGSLLAISGRAAADDTPKPDIKPLLKNIRVLVEKYYPKAKVTLKDQTIQFEFNTRKYMIHEAFLSGEWQDAFEEIGPQKGGIMGDIELRAGKWGGQASLPQSFDKRYFTVLAMAPYSKKLDHHLLVDLKYPRDVPKEFVKQFVDLVDGFETLGQAKGK